MRVVLLTAAMALVVGCKKDTQHGAPGQACKADGDCQSQLKCSDSKCRGTQAGGGACTSEWDCVTGKCVEEMCRGMMAEGASCGKTFNCADGLHCLTGSCQSVGKAAEAIATRACACQALACIQKHEAQLKSFSTRFSADAAVDKASRDQMKAATKKAAECRQKAVFSGMKR